ncbi:MAG TPA: LysM peptidoglycan-binding domain-containing protein [Ferruginibacter sp.]|nr:LysM peptidoglycan-binding domain-containing protein [Ferruginibacter sp.]HMP20771.1 LysM peptidoglycan-binding domain-containing protein [Ferruginibacter sp.]
MKHTLILAMCLPFIAAAQSKPLMIEGTAPDFYITHTVAPKENYYSIGRLYNISPKEIAPFNNLQLDKGLNLNQTIKVPLTEGNFVQSSAAEPDEALVPVYYTVKEKEGLYRISTNFNKVPIETLKFWNNIQGDAVGNGTKLVVGYLKVKKELSPLAATAKPVATAPIVTTTPVKPPATVETKKETAPVARPTDTEKTAEAVVQKKPEPPVPVKPVQKEEPVKETPVVQNNNIGGAPKNSGGYFKPEYEKQSKNGGRESGTAGVFKSTSGWQDGRYYCLFNGAPSRSFVKITNTVTGKSVYAKVLDAIPDISQNSGLLILLSNAAAAELGAADSRFDCTVQYSK